jgi:hypothetical protein
MRMKLLEVALLYYQDFIEQHAEDPSLQAELADSQARAACILQELPAMLHYRHFELLGNRSVQDDLGLSPAQRADIAAGEEEMLRRWKKDAEGLLQPVGFPGQGAAERARWCEQAIADLLTPAQPRRLQQIAYQQMGIHLTPAQARRLQQIAYQQMGIRAFNHAAVVEALGLSRAQRKDLVYRYQLERIRQEQELWRATPLTSTLEQVYQKILEQRRLSMERTLEVLTAQQRARWQELTGEPFRGDIRLLLARGRRSPY